MYVNSLRAYMINLKTENSDFGHDLRATEFEMLRRHKTMAYSLVEVAGLADESSS